MEPIPEPPISCHSPPSSPAPTFHHLLFLSSPPRSRRNPFPSLPSHVVLLPPLPYHLSRTSLPPSPLSVVASQIWTEPIPEPPIFYRSPPSFPAPTFHHLLIAIVASQIWMEPIPDLPISCRSPSSSRTLAFHHLRFPSSPSRSGWNPFPGRPSPAVLLPPLLHQPFTIPLAVVDATRMGDRKQEISTEPLPCSPPSSPTQSFHDLRSPSWTPLGRETGSGRSPLNPLLCSPPSSPALAFHHLGLAIVDAIGTGIRSERSGRRESMAAGESQGGVQLPEMEPEWESRGHGCEVF